ncbi:MAG TPA: permease-like cell division protein FtsX [Candidatus Dormibacteraeota bacterium]|nr:permease-like cell division protein FtsX [Candidatus Dormibacteraeota bacterium]
MDWGRVKFFLGEVFANLTRNAAMQITAIGTVAVAIAMLGAFLFVQKTATVVGGQALQQIEVSAFLKDGLDAKIASDLTAKVAQLPGVAHVAYVPKAEGLKELRARLQGEVDTSLLTTNPLPDALRIRAQHVADVPVVAAAVKALPGVAEVHYGAETVQKLLRLMTIAKRIGIGVILMLVVASFLIVSNTIRLTVYARRREIAIMKLVGATNNYIRLPFIAEGVVAGLVGAAVAVGLLSLAQHQLLPKLAQALPFVPFPSQLPDLIPVALQLLGAGALVGAIASWISVGRYLRV